MGVELLPERIRSRYLVDERRHACAILATDFQSEWADLIECLERFKLVRSEIVAGGGGKSKIAARFDEHLVQRGWREKATEIVTTVDGQKRHFDTHKVDLCKGRVAVEVEWNNKDPFFSRDLNAFRLLHELGVISAGVIITRSDELQGLFDSLGNDTTGKRVGRKYGAATTHWGKLLPRVNSGGGGACPLLLFGILPQCYRDDTDA